MQSIKRKGVAGMTLQEVLFFRVKAEGEWFHELKLQNLQDGWNASRALETAQAEARYWSLYQVLEEEELEEAFWQWMNSGE